MLVSAPGWEREDARAAGSATVAVREEGGSASTGGAGAGADVVVGMGCGGDGTANAGVGARAGAVAPLGPPSFSSVDLAAEVAALVPIGPTGTACPGLGEGGTSVPRALAGLFIIPPSGSGSKASRRADFAR